MVVMVVAVLLLLLLAALLLLLCVVVDGDAVRVSVVLLLSKSLWLFLPRTLLREIKSFFGGAVLLLQI